MLASGRRSFVLQSRLALGASSFALAASLAAPSAYAQDCDTVEDGVCVVVVDSAETGTSVAASGPTRIENSGQGTIITHPYYFDYLRVDNVAGASIASISLSPPASFPLPAFGPVGTTIFNAGTINGNLILPQNGVYVNLGGTVTGNFGALNGGASYGTPQFQSGNAPQTYIDRAGTGAGNFDPGAGIDVYVTSYGDGNWSHSMASPLPTHFELGGVEVLTAGSTVTLDGTAYGQALWGVGSVINTGTINGISSAGSGLPTSSVGTTAVTYAGMAGANNAATFVVFDPVANINRVYGLLYGNTLSGFTNKGTINGDLSIQTASLVNESTIGLGSTGTLIFARADSAFTFNNSGQITADNIVAPPGGTLTDAGVTLVSALDSTMLAPVVIDNSGLIEAGLSFSGFASAFTFDNSGTITMEGNPNGIDRAVSLELGEIELPGSIEIPDEFLVGAEHDIVADSASITNSGQILGGIEGELNTRSLIFVNSALIMRDPNDPFAEAVEFEVDDFDGPLGDDDVDADFVSFSNLGQISGRTALDFSASVVELSNSGSMTQDTQLDATVFPYQFGALEVDVETNLGADVSFSNSGIVSAADHAAVAVEIEAYASDGVSKGVSGAELTTARIDVVNSGTIESTGGVFLIPGGLIGRPLNEVLYKPSAGLVAVADGAAGSSVTINNEEGGVISGRGLGYIANVNGATVFQGQDAQLAGGIAVAAVADTVSITNAGTLLGGPGAISFSLPNGGILVPDADVDFEGVIGGAIDTFYGADTIVNAATGVIEGGIATRSGNDRLTNYGSITGRVLMGFGNDNFTNLGSFAGTVDLADGNDVMITMLKNIGSRFVGSADGGIGVDTFVFNVSEGGSLQDMQLANISNFEYIAIGGAGTVTSDGGTAMAPIQIALGDITLAVGSTLTAATEFALRGDADLAQKFTNLGTIHGSVFLGAQDDTFANYGALDGNLDLGIGNDTFIQGINAVLTGTADGGAGTDKFFLDITGGGTIDQSIYTKLINFETLSLLGTGPINTGGSGPLPVETIEVSSDEPVVFGPDAVIETQGPVAITGTDANNTVTIQGTVNGAIDLGGGDNTLDNSGTVNGDITTGAGSDEIANTGTIAGNVNTGDGDDKFVNQGTVGGDVLLDGGTSGSELSALLRLASASLSPIRLTAELPPVPTAGNDVFDNEGTIEGDVYSGGGNDMISNSGTIEGGIFLEDGNDVLLLSGAWVVDDLIDGGDGEDMLGFAGSGTTQAPREITGSQFNSFETLEMTSGVVAVSGSLTLEEIDVTGGYLFGRTGSFIAGDVHVASGAIFGSAGTVNGDITVSGTLSPGASPGTLTVNGDVTLGSGSVTLFEMTSAVSDAIVINGSLDIANGTTLNITGSRPLTPGITYNLIYASGGIDGHFSTINQDSTVLGFVNQTDKALQLLGTFQLHAGASGQAELATDYYNALLIAGTAPAGLIAAIPELVGNDGYVSESSVLSTTAEAYASAAQTGIENGLAISAAVRDATRAGSTAEAGIFVFGQGFGQWRGFGPEFATGVSGARLRSYGALGGIGFGFGPLSATAFAGQVNGRQHFDSLLASTRSDGIFAGGNLALRSGGLSAGATVIYDWSEADTSRALFDGSTARGGYDMHTLTLDGRLGYGMPLSGGWQIGPEVGLTYLDVTRKGLTEAGAGVFSLTVAKQGYNATFLSGDLLLSHPVGGWRPYLEVGVRHQVDGDPITATASLADISATYAILGAERQETYAHVGAGLAVDVTPTLELFGKWNSDFAKGRDAEGISAGMRLRF